MRKLPLLLAIVLLLVSCGDKPLTEQEFQMGTVITITAYDRNGRDHIEGCFDVISDVERMLDFHVEDSELGYLNAHAHEKPVVVSRELYDLIRLAYDITEMTDGAFNLCIGPLVALWDIGGENARVPSQEEIDGVLPLLDWHDLVLDDADCSVWFRAEGMMLDLGGIGKGFAADRVVSYLRDNGVGKALVNLGGNVYALGSKDRNTPWKIGIRKPEDDSSGYFTVLDVSDESVVTSGAYERYLIAPDGTRYHHILDSGTGYPAESDMVSVTIMDESSTLADALSTAVFAMGSERGGRLLESLGVEGVLLLDDGSIAEIRP